MDIKREIRDAERLLASAGISIRQFADLVPINAESWRLWRSGKNLPQLGKWLKVQAALEAIRSDRRKELGRKRAARKAAAERATKPAP